MPREIETARLVLRCWRGEDAVELLPILEANWGHLSPWIPHRVAQPVPVEELRDRLQGNADRFAEDREWRYAMRARDTGRLLGEVSLFPRSATGRVALGESDRAELGYWMRVDETGRGLVTEAVEALIAAAGRIPRFTLLEIRCDERNVASAAIPRRLAFTLAATLESTGVRPEDGVVQLQLWVRPMTQAESREAAT